MKTIKLIMTSQEDCNCNCSHDTVVSENYDSVKSLLNHYESDFEDYEAHDHSVSKSAEMQIEESGVIKAYGLLNQTWDYNKKESWTYYSCCRMRC